MDVILKIFSSPIFVAIAWICTVVSCVYAFVQKSNVNNITQRFDNLKIKNSSLQQRVDSLEVSYNSLQVKNNSLEQEIVEIKNNDIHDNYQDVHQNGQNNFNQGVIKGDFVYNK